MRSDELFELMQPSIDAVNELFKFNGMMGPMPRPFHPMKTDMSETDTEYLFEIDLPGYAKENVTISLEDKMLKVVAEKTEEREHLKHKERFSGRISREYYVGENIDTANTVAKFENGVLEITVPKKEKEVPNNRIEIQ